MGRARPTAPRHQQGTATVEMAIMLPVLMLMLLAVAEFGRMISQYDTLTKAVRDGARYAASVSALGSTGLVSITSTIQTDVANLVVTGDIGGTGTPLLPGLSAADVTVADAGNGYVSVTATYTYEPMIGPSLPTFGLGPSVPLDVPLTATTVMRAL